MSDITRRQLFAIAASATAAPASRTEIPVGRLIGSDTSGGCGVEELTVNGGIEFTGTGGVHRTIVRGDKE